MGSLSMVVLAEVMAILRCTELLQTKNLMRKRIHICCDSRAALAALAKTTTKSSLVWECRQVLGRVSELNNVTLVWILGSEEVDRLAKEGAIEVPPNHFAAVPFNVGKKDSSRSIWNCSIRPGGLPTVQNVDGIPSAC
jgi:hypothetical protein